MNQTKTWDLQIHLVEHESDTAAEVILTTDAGAILTAKGVARRNPRDPDVPMIGDELACSRALGELAGKLLETAATEIGKIEHRPVHLNH